MQKSKRSPLSILLITLLAVVAFSFIAYILFKQFGPKPRVASLNDFINDLKAAAKNSADNKYIAKLEFDSYFGTARYVFVDGSVAIEKIAEIDRINAAFYSSTHSLIGEALAKSLGDKDKFMNLTPYDFFTKHVLTFEKDGKEFVGLLSSKPLSDGQPSLLRSLITSLLPTFVMVLLLFFLYRYLMKKNMSMMGAIGDERNPAKKVKSDKTFKDVAGNKEAIEEIEEIVDYLKNPKKYALAGARMPHGILLGGPPGTGKTLLAKATAGEANVPFYFISASNFVEMYVGLGAKRVRTVFEEARKNAPAIIFIDELDAIGRTRGAGLGGGHDEREQTLNQLLVEMDGMTQNNGILIFAATNRTDVLDPALTRPGRFDRTVTVGLPDVKERAEILELHAKGKRLSPEIKLDQVAKRTPGFSGAQLENVINEASLIAVRANSDVIRRDDIDEGIDRVMAGPAKKNRVITKEELTMVAYHEAGHAVVGLKVKGGNKVQKITIIPRGNAGGYNLMTPEEEKYNATKQELIAMITGFMGGRASEELIYGKDHVSTGASDDISKATKIARKMVTEFGMSRLGPIQYEKDEGSPFLGRDYLKSASFSSQVAHEIDLEVRRIIIEAEANATKIIKENRELLELIKSALLENETIVAEEIEYIEKNMKLPPKKELDNTKAKVYTLDELISSDKKEEKNSTEKEDSKE
ncbi:ATP-dependent zinc metalloprotease FtsH [Mycoplasmopsis caviae]|uniref:ATP-dependent zinc metalloprotease FtsH n=1 Tax=Mycoplasmopsis caviae TaxID=55603 RepID=A0A3P8MDL5_9BACT|nr:ATP-dependent zinc metalloprotease FtsH [Mycoplasmopsis caviae]UUD35246.1 ATP-dependent zinc metalloprotease FtsH [Mycoplasmopsis caviae]VDR41970.1 ATPase, AAA family [Mycoplasmopsis caviae]